MNKNFDHLRLYNWLGAALVFSIILGSGILLVKTEAIEPFVVIEPDVHDSIEAEATTEILGEKMVNLNEANLEQLDTLEGIGPATAQKIIDYRGQIGGFSSIEQVMDVSGIGEAKYEKIKDELSV